MKFYLIVLLFITVFNLFSETVNLPMPLNFQLYTEFTAVKTSKFLKKPLQYTGYIAMDGKNNFIYKHTKPVEIIVRKSGTKLTYKTNSSGEIDISGSSSGSGDNIAFIFDENVSKDYEITKKSLVSGEFEFTMIPKKVHKILQVKITSKDDKFITIDMYFSDKSLLKYTFSNTVTGSPPDSKYF